MLQKAYFPGKASQIFINSLLLLFLFGLWGCQNGCLKGQGKIISQKMTLEPYSILKVHGWLDVVLQKGNVTEATIEAGKNMVPNIKITREENGNALVIKNENKCHWSRGGRQPLVKLTFQDIAQIEQWGFGNITSLDTLKGSSLTVRISGNGNVNLLVDVINFNCSMLELGDLTVQGRSERSNLFSHNVGFFKGKNFFTRHCTARTRDEGEFQVSVSDTLIATIESTGSITYFGKPKFIETNITGAGRVISGD